MGMFLCKILLPYSRYLKRENTAFSRYSVQTYVLLYLVLVLLLIMDVVILYNVIVGS